MSQTNQALLVGINYPWINYGWDFGDPPPGWTGGKSLAEWRAKQQREIVADLSKFASLGLFAVRWLCWVTAQIMVLVTTRRS